MAPTKGSSRTKEALVLQGRRLTARPIPPQQGRPPPSPAGRSGPRSAPAARFASAPAEGPRRGLAAALRRRTWRPGAGGARPAPASTRRRKRGAYPASSSFLLALIWSPSAPFWLAAAPAVPAAGPAPAAAVPAVAAAAVAAPAAGAPPVSACCSPALSAASCPFWVAPAAAANCCSASDMLPRPQRREGRQAPARDERGPAGQRGGSPRRAGLIRSGPAPPPLSAIAIPPPLILTLKPAPNKIRAGRNRIKIPQAQELAPLPAALGCYAPAPPPPSPPPETRTLRPGALTRGRLYTAGASATQQ